MSLPEPDIADLQLRTNLDYLDSKIAAQVAVNAEGGAVAKFVGEGFIIPPEGVALSREGNTITASDNGRVRRTVSVTSIDIGGETFISHGYSEPFTPVYPLEFSLLPAVLWANLGEDGYVFAIVKITQLGDDDTPCSFEVLEDLSIGVDRIMFLGPFFPGLETPVATLFIARTSLSGLTDANPEAMEFFGSSDIAFGGYFVGGATPPVETPIGVKSALIDIPEDTSYDLDLGEQNGRIFVTCGVDSELAFTGSTGTPEDYGWELVIHNDGYETLTITGLEYPYPLYAGDAVKLFIINGEIRLVTI